MTKFFVELFNSSDGVYKELADILREGVVEELHASRLVLHIFGYVFVSFSSCVSIWYVNTSLILISVSERSSNISIGGNEISSLLNCASHVRKYLGHYQVLKKDVYLVSL